MSETEPRALREFRVVDVMHPGVIACPRETPLRTVARMMATYRVHAVAVMAHEDDDGAHRSLWVSSPTQTSSGRHGQKDIDTETAGTLARRPTVTISTTDSLERAATLMAEHETTHLIVVERRSQRPIGIVSTLDIARGLAGYRIEGSGKLTPWAAAL